MVKYMICCMPNRMVSNTNIEKSSFHHKSVAIIIQRYCYCLMVSIYNERQESQPSQRVRIIIIIIIQCHKYVGSVINILDWPDEFVNHFYVH